MAKFRDCKFEVTAEQIAFGAVAGAGIGLLALGVKKLFNAKNMKASRDYMKEYPIESDLDDEEYDMEATEACVADFDKWWKMDLCQGLFTITFGSLLAAFGVTMLTPGRKYIVDSSVAKKVTELDIPEKLLCSLRLPVLIVAFSVAIMIPVSLLLRQADDLIKKSSEDRRIRNEF